MATNTMIAYQNNSPNVGEDKEQFGHRLECDGHEEMYIRKALRHHFGMSVDEAAQLCSKLETARLRHISLIRSIEPNRNRSSMVKKIVGNLNISSDEAERFIDRLESAN